MRLHRCVLDRFRLASGLSCLLFLLGALWPTAARSEVVIRGSTLTLAGAAADLDALMSVMNAASSSNVWFHSPSGPADPAFPASYLEWRSTTASTSANRTAFENEVLNFYFGEDNLTTARLTVGRNIPGVLLGQDNIVHPGQQKIDLADIAKFPESSLFLDTRTSVIAHEMAEAYYRDGGSSLDTSHRVGIRSQNRVLSGSGGMGRRLQEIDHLVRVLDPHGELLVGGAYIAFEERATGTRYYEEIIFDGTFRVEDVNLRGILNVDTGVEWSGREVDIGIASVTLRAVPEPGTMIALLGMGAIALVIYRPVFSARPRKAVSGGRR